jgi:hypothetical protein
VEATLLDNAGKELCGAFYVSITKEQENKGDLSPAAWG